MGGTSSKSSVRFERRASRRQSQKNVFHAILNQTKDISVKMSETKGPLTQDQYVEFKTTLENATKRLNSLGGQLKSKNANTYKQACQFVNDTFIYLETKMSKNLTPSEGTLDRPKSGPSNVVEAVVEPSNGGSQRDSITSQVTLKQMFLQPELPNIQEEPQHISAAVSTEHLAAQPPKQEEEQKQTPMEQIQAIRKNVDELNGLIKIFQGSKYDEDYTNLVCALDENEVVLENISSFGDEIIRQEKKNVYIFIQQCLNTLESKCGMYKKFTDESEDEQQLPAPPPPEVLNNVNKNSVDAISSSDEESYITNQVPSPTVSTFSQQQQLQPPYQRKVVTTQV